MTLYSSPSISLIFFILFGDSTITNFTLYDLLFLHSIMDNLNIFFSNELERLVCDDDTKAYIVSILSKYKHTTYDYSKDSITLLFAEAKFNHDFFRFQNIGDWLFYSFSLYPEHLNNASREYYCSIGQMSYYSCYRLMNRQWKVYERLSDDFL